MPMEDMTGDPFKIHSKRDSLCKTRDTNISSKRSLLPIESRNLVLGQVFLLLFLFRERERESGSQPNPGAAAAAWLVAQRQYEVER